MSFKYDSGTKTSLESASRRALITGLNQTVATLQLERANELETDLVEVSSHAGARPTHAEWQGQIYSLSGKHPHYDNFYDATEYGFGDGLCGWNCYHSFYPYVEGVSTPSFDRDPARELGMSNDELYELTQDQRYLERQVRASRRECQTLDAAMTEADDALADQLREEFSKAAVCLKKREAKLQEFCKQNGLPYDASRVTTFNFGRSTSAKAVWANRKAAEIQRTYVAGFRAMDDRSLTSLIVDGNMKSSRTYGNDHVNERHHKPLSQKEINDAESAMRRQGYQGQIIYSEYSDTAFHGSVEGERYHYIVIGMDAYPKDGETGTANELISLDGCAAHEVIGHYEAWMKGTTQAEDLLEEVQASIRASRFGICLSETDRQLLFQDAMDRLQSAGIRYEDVKNVLDIRER